MQHGPRRRIHGPANLYRVDIPLEAGKRVVAFTLPADPALHLFSVTLVP